MGSRPQVPGTASEPVSQLEANSPATVQLLCPFDSEGQPCSTRTVSNGRSVSIGNIPAQRSSSYEPASGTWWGHVTGSAALLHGVTAFKHLTTARWRRALGVENNVCVSFCPCLRHFFIPAALTEANEKRESRASGSLQTHLVSSICSQRQKSHRNRSWRQRCTFAVSQEAQKKGVLSVCVLASCTVHLGEALSTEGRWLPSITDTHTHTHTKEGRAIFHLLSHG